MVKRSASGVDSNPQRAVVERLPIARSLPPELPEVPFELGERLRTVLTSADGVASRPLREQISITVNEITDFAHYAAERALLRLFDGDTSDVEKGVAEHVLSKTEELTALDKALVAVLSLNDPIYRREYSYIYDAISRARRRIFGDYEVLLDIIALLTPDDRSKGLSVDEKLDLLAGYASQFGGEGIRALHRELFPELHSVPTTDLPETAPAKWREDKLPGETPPGFVKRVYGEWLGKGFTRATLRHLDPPLAQAITNWLRHNDWPADVDLPTLKEQNTRWVDRVGQEGLAAVVPDGSTDQVIRESRRLQNLQSRRRRDTQIS